MLPRISSRFNDLIHPAHDFEEKCIKGSLTEQLIYFFLLKVLHINNLYVLNSIYYCMVKTKINNVLDNYSGLDTNLIEKCNLLPLNRIMSCYNFRPKAGSASVYIYIRTRSVVQKFAFMPASNISVFRTNPAVFVYFFHATQQTRCPQLSQVFTDINKYNLLVQRRTFHFYFYSICPSENVAKNETGNTGDDFLEWPDHLHLHITAHLVPQCE